MMDAKFDTQLRSALALTQQAGEEHPDANSLNRFCQGQLSRSARERVLSHLAACSRCREVVSLTAPPAQRRSHAVRWAAGIAAGLVLLFAGSTSRVDNAPIRDISMLPVPAIDVYSSSKKLAFAYANAELQIPDATLKWRVRQNGTLNLLEVSADGGRTWRPAKLREHFEPESVGFRGPDVWITGRSGEMLVSRDAGRRWVRVRPQQTR